MRLKILLKSKDYSPLSINYNYALSSAIYKLLRLGSPEFSQFLHNKGFILNSKPFKLFTFGLKLKDFRVTDSKFNFISPLAELYISSTLIDDFIKNILIGSFINQTLEIYSEYQKTVLYIQQVEIIPDPIFSENMNFDLLSPIVLTIKKEHNGALKPYYLRYDDDLLIINNSININLINKFRLISNKEYNNSYGVTLNWDDSYIQDCLSKNKKLSRKTTITKYEDMPIDIVGINVPFSISGDPELIKIGYEAGFGEKNSMGFGMVN